jgi:hypothetical protein
VGRNRQRPQVRASDYSETTRPHKKQRIERGSASEGPHTVLVMGGGIYRLLTSPVATALSRFEMRM